MRMSVLAVIILFLTSANLSSAWSVQTAPTAYNLHEVSFVDPAEGWACGNYGTIIHTSNAGVPWLTQDSQTLDHLYSIHFVDGNNGWAVGASGTIRHTADGGATPWEIQTSGVAWHLYGVHFLDENEGWAVGAAGTILHTVDAGTTWSGTFPTTDEFHDVFFYDQTRGWIVGKSVGFGVMGRTTNGGLNWLFTYPSQFLYDLHFVDSQQGWACGTNGEIVHTSNGGGSWTTQHSGGVHLNGIWLVDQNNGWAVGELGTILKTTNGGGTWTPDTSPVSVHLNAVCFPDLNNGWAVGDNGTVIRYRGVGVAESSITNDQLPMTNDQLLQNYPNPFSCTTTITYHLPARRGDTETGRGGDLSTYHLMNLSIHDLSGRLIRTLLHREPISDTQFPISVIWDGKDDMGREVTSAVYLCQLRIGNLRETRNLTLLR